MTSVTAKVQFARVGRAYVYKMPLPASLPSGTYVLSFMVAGDPVMHSVQITI